jgi:hypothetical protein
MPKMEDFHKVGGFIHAVIDQDRGMHQLPHPRTPLHRASDIRKAFEKFNMVEYGVAEPLGTGGKVGPGIGENFLKVC